MFIYKNWKKFCEQLEQRGIRSIPICEVTSCTSQYLVLKHDVETNVSKAYKIATIEKTCGHRGTYYVQAYLLQDKKNIKLLIKMQEMGHEISYHYDVMDYAKGDIEKAIDEFEKNIKMFIDNGFNISTVCQHGNPVIERVGYSSNRDFFRNLKVQELYPEICDVMVNFKSKMNTDYNYYSDAGRKFQLIYDPINNDVVNSDDKNISYENLDTLVKELALKAQNSIISIHPHRWTRFAVIHMCKTILFKCVKRIAKILMKVTLLKKIMSRFYYLAKKI